MVFGEDTWNDLHSHNEQDDRDSSKADSIDEQLRIARRDNSSLLPETWRTTCLIDDWTNHKQGKNERH